MTPNSFQDVILSALFLLQTEAADTFFMPPLKTSSQHLFETQTREIYALPLCLGQIFIQP